MDNFNNLINFLTENEGLKERLRASFESLDTQEKKDFINRISEELLQVDGEIERILSSKNYTGPLNTNLKAFQINLMLNYLHRVFSGDDDSIEELISAFNDKFVKANEILEKKLEEQVAPEQQQTGGGDDYMKKYLKYKKKYLRMK